MQLGGGAPSGPQPRTVAEAITRGATSLGHRPAVSLLLTGGRQEQSGASLAQWAAKGAHLLVLDLLLEPGDEVRLDAPWSWTTAAVALAVWWAGGVVRLDGTGDASTAVIGADGDPGGAEDVFVLGDGIDGAPTVAAAPERDSGHEAWTRAAQPFPDQPPPSHAAAGRPAIRHGARELDQRAVLELAGSQGTTGNMGLLIGTGAGRRPAGSAHAAGADEVVGADGGGDAQVTDVDAATALTLVALRPLLSGRPTVILRGVPRATAAGDRVERWARTT